jgi:hypothetical protein
MTNMALIDHTDDPLAVMVPRRLASPLLDDYVGIVKAWIQKCETQLACAKGASTRNRLPTRVIDVGSADGAANPFLHEAREGMGVWVTLSHRWGDVYPLTLTLATLDERRNKIPMDR